MRYELQVDNEAAEKPLKIKIAKNGEEVDILINGELVVWFEDDGDLVIDQEALENFGLTLRGIGGKALHNTNQE